MGMAVEMSTLCEQKALHSELRELCVDMKTAQRREITMLQGWLLDWYRNPHTPRLASGDARQLHRLSHLAGQNFEQAFLDMMVRHHHVAIRRSAGCLEQAQHGALISMCEEMIQAQLDESRLMKSWQCSWYQRCPRP
jgi:uncharacterized protein (DUF305 family)